MYQFKVVYSLFLGTMLLIFSEGNAFAHGEDKPGPHGGIIRMPGAFHTEIVAIDKRKVAVYLIDIQFKEPITENSSVSVKVSQERSSSPLKCEPQGDHFVCSTPSGITLEKGTLEVVAKRREAQGVAASYPLPISGK